MGAQFTVNADLGRTWTDAEGVEKPLWDIVPGSSSLPEDTSMSYGGAARLLSAFGLDFDAEFYCGSLDPLVVLARRSNARKYAEGYAVGCADCGVEERGNLAYRVEALIGLAAEAVRTPGAKISYG